MKNPKRRYTDVTMPGKTINPYLYRRQSSSRKTPQRPPTRRSAGATTTKYKQEKYRSLSEGRAARTAMEQEQYLKFSLTVTEALLKTDLFKNERIRKILKEHYDANRAILDEGRLIQTISDICYDLNIPMDSKFLNFLKENRTKSVSTETDSQLYQPFEQRKSTSHCLFSDTSVEVSQSPPNSSQDLQMFGDVSHNEFFDFFTKTSSDKNELDLRKVETPDVGFDKYVRKILLNELLNKKFVNAGSEGCACAREEDKMKVKGIDVLHEVTSKYVNTSCSEVESYDSAKPHESVVPVKSNNKLFSNNSSNWFKKSAKKLVAAHYYTSVEPEILDRKELSVQTAEQGQTREYGLSDSCDASTQSASISFFSAPTISASDEMKERMNSGMFSEGVQYVVLDYPLLVPTEHKKYDFVDVRKSQYQNTFNINQGMSHGTQTSSCNNYTLPNQWANHIPLSRNVFEKRVSTNIKESLSCFYPTTATQVSSMDLVNARTTRRHTLFQQREREFSQISRMSSNRSKSVDSSFPKSCDKLEPYRFANFASLSKRESVQNRRQDVVLDQNEYRVDFKQRVWNKVVNLGNDAQDSLGRKNKTESHEWNNALVSPVNSRRSSTSVSEKTIHFNRDSVRRTKYLQHDIKRLSRDDSHLKRNVSGSLRRADFFVILKRNSHCSITKEHLPSEMPLPKRKRMTILRKESDWEIGEMAANEIH